MACLEFLNTGEGSPASLVVNNGFLKGFPEPSEEPEVFSVAWNNSTCNNKVDLNPIPSLIRADKVVGNLMTANGLLERFYEETGMLTEENMVDRKGLKIPPTVKDRLQKGVYQSWEVPEELKTACRAKVLYKPRTPMVVGDVRIEAQRWIKQRACLVPEEVKRRWVEEVVTWSLQASPAELEMIDKLDGAYGKEIELVSQLAVGKKVKPRHGFRIWLDKTRDQARKDFGAFGRVMLPFWLGDRGAGFYQSDTPR